MFCCALLYVDSSFAIILMWKREVVALLSFFFLVSCDVVYLFLAVPWVCLHFVIVVFPDYTNLLFQVTAGNQTEKGSLPHWDLCQLKDVNLFNA